MLAHLADAFLAGKSGLVEALSLSPHPLPTFPGDPELSAPKFPKSGLLL